jgi:acetyltransferase-like isoleucine patch superfamily enzyme
MDIRKIKVFLKGLLKSHTKNVKELVCAKEAEYVKVVESVKVVPKPNLIKEEGENNKVFLIRSGVETEITHAPQGLSIIIRGDNNRILINDNVRFSSTKINIYSSNTSIKIGKNSFCKNMLINLPHGVRQSVVLGESFTCDTLSIIISDSGAFHVGDNCIFSHGIRVWGSDGHSIFDKESGKLINYSNKMIKIGANTLVGKNVLIVKSASVAANSIVEPRSVLTRKIDEEFVVIGGNPAVIVKRGVTWKREKTITLKKKNG